MEKERSALVIGHQNPDTDSICSAIAYAYLKQKAEHLPCKPARAGKINPETAYVLKRFGIAEPQLCTDVSPRVCDIDVREVPVIDKNMSLRSVWTIMRDEAIDTLPVLRADKTLEGVITVKDLATANMDIFDRTVLAKSRTSYANILETLKGTMICGNPDEIVEKGRIVIGAGSSETLESTIEEGDIVLLSNRYESQLCAIEMNAGCIVVCMGQTIPKMTIKLAQMSGCTIISTEYDTYAAAQLLSQSAPVGYYMTQDNLLKFTHNTPIESVRRVMARVRHRYFPIVDSKGHCSGVISRRNLLNLHRKQVILVDHNERTQAVEGIEEAEILEIIDHHRLGTLETSGPVYFRNQPVGCTATIVYQLYQEKQVEVPQAIAGLLLSAIISDTLLFRSPTCTAADIQAAQQLCEIAKVELETLAEEMFEAGGNLSGKTPKEVLMQDFKIFTADEIRFGVGQGNFMTERNRQQALELLPQYLPQAVQENGIQMLFYLATDIPDGCSQILYAGKDAEETLHLAFGIEPLQGVILPKVVSRKRQFIPAIMEALHEL